MSRLPADIKANVLEFVRLDDGLKKAREDMKEARTSMNESRDAIIEYMKEAEVERLGIKKGQQFLELTEKTLKIRPSADVVKAKLAELMQKGIMDPSVIYEELNKCGGTKQVWKLARRTKRVAKKRSASAVEGSSEGPAKKKKKTTEAE